jgi:hypothetical protein
VRAALTPAGAKITPDPNTVDFADEVRFTLSADGLKTVYTVKLSQPPGLYAGD